MDMIFSVIIPTYNRKDILKKCLNALFSQTYPQSEYEIIVVDDGSTDGTEELVRTIINDSPCTLRYFKQRNKGPAAARNVGIKNSNGEIILFIGDDIISTPTLVEEHIKWHKEYPDSNVAVLGYITWSPEVKITPFMKWLENGGPQFHFWQISHKVDVDTKDYFYTSNISMKRKFLLENNGFFDEDFPYAAFEDIELGYRLKKKGMILKYNKEAIGYHYHYISLDDCCKRMIRVGESSLIMAKKLGERQDSFSLNESSSLKILTRIRTLVYYFIAKACYPIAKFYEMRGIKKNIFNFVMGYYCNIGVKMYKDKIKGLNPLTGC